MSGGGYITLDVAVCAFGNTVGVVLSMMLNIATCACALGAIINFLVKK